MRHLTAVPDPEDLYGWVPFLANSSKPPVKLTIAVQYGKDDDPGTDIVLDPNGWVLRHKYSLPRESTEGERAAVGWTW